MEPIEIIDDDEPVIEIITDSELESPKFKSTQKQDQDQSYNVIPITLDSSPIQEISCQRGADSKPLRPKRSFSTLDSILRDDDSDDDDIVIKPRATKKPKSTLFVPPDSSFSEVGTPQRDPKLGESKRQLEKVLSSSQKGVIKEKRPQLSSSQANEVLSINSSSQPTKQTPKVTRMPIQRTRSEITSSTEKSKNPISTNKYLDSDSDGEVGTKFNPITHLKQKEKLFLSSTPEKIDASSSIGEIRPSAHPSRPLYPLDKIRKKKDIELSDSDSDNLSIDVAKKVAESDGNEVLNPFLDILTKHTHRNDQRLERVRAHELVRTIKSTLVPETAESSSISVSRSYSNTALPVQVESGIGKPAKRNRTTGTTRKSKEERELEKERQLKDKQARQLYQDANRVNRKKDDLLMEMIIKLPRQVIRDLKGQDHKAELSPIEIQEVINPENVVTWSRKTRSNYDFQSDTFQPCNLQILDEKVCVFVYTAVELLKIMEMETLIMKFNEFRIRNKQFNNFIILINGYDQIIQKLKTQENRQYTAKVRSQMSANDDNEIGGIAGVYDGFEPGKKTNSRGKKKTTTKRATSISSHTAGQIEEEFAQLQVNGFKVFPTKNNHETLLWLKSFTYTISSARYDKLERNPDLANIGTVKSGVNTHDTYLKMLLQFKFMTEVKANRIIDQLPTVSHLYNAVSQNKIPLGPDGRPLMMSNIQSSIIKLFSTMDDGELLER